MGVNGTLINRERSIGRRQRANDSFMNKNRAFRINSIVAGVIK